MWYHFVKVTTGVFYQWWIDSEDFCDIFRAIVPFQNEGICTLFTPKVYILVPQCIMYQWLLKGQHFCHFLLREYDVNQWLPKLFGCNILQNKMRRFEMTWRWVNWWQKLMKKETSEQWYIIRISVIAVGEKKLRIQFLLTIGLAKYPKN